MHRKCEYSSNFWHQRWTLSSWFKRRAPGFSQLPDASSEFSSFPIQMSFYGTSFLPLIKGIVNHSFFFSFYRKESPHWLTCDVKIPNLWKMHAHNTQAILRRGGSGAGTSLELLLINCENWISHVTFYLISSHLKSGQQYSSSPLWGLIGITYGKAFSSINR